MAEILRKIDRRYVKQVPRRLSHRPGLIQEINSFDKSFFIWRTKPSTIGKTLSLVQVIDMLVDNEYDTIVDVLNSNGYSRRIKKTPTADELRKLMKDMLIPAFTNIVFMALVHVFSYAFRITSGSEQFGYLYLEMKRRDNKQKVKGQHEKRYNE